MGVQERGAAVIVCEHFGVTAGRELGDTAAATPDSLGYSARQLVYLPANSA